MTAVLMLCAIVGQAADLETYFEGHGVLASELDDWKLGTGKLLAKQAAEAELAELETKYEESRRGQVDRRLKEPKRVRAGNVTRINFPDDRAKRDELSKLRDGIAAKKKEIEDGPPALKPLLRPGRMAVGKVGVLYRAVEVRQVIDNTTALVASGDDTVFILRVDASKLVSDKSYDLGATLYEVAGTTTYKTLLGGTNTVFVVQPYVVK